MKKIVSYLIIFSLFTNLLFSQYTITQRAPWEWVKETFFYENMISNAINTVNTLRENYEKSKEFFDKAVYYYEKIKQAQENPYGLLSDNEIKKFLTKYESTQHLLNTYEKVNKIYTDTKKDIDQMVEGYENMRDKIYSDIENTKKILKNNIDYLQSNWKFVEKAVKNMQQQSSNLIEDLKGFENFKNAPNEDKKIKAEELKTKIGLSQLQAQQETNMLILKLIEIQNKQMEQMLLSQREIVDRQNMFYQSVKPKE